MNQYRGTPEERHKKIVTNMTLKKDEKQLDKLANAAMVYGWRVGLESALERISSLQNEPDGLIVLQFRRQQALAEMREKKSRAERGRK